MTKIRVHELANELGLTSKTLLSYLQQAGEFVRSPSSTLERPVADRTRRAFGQPDPPPSTETTLATPRQNAASGSETSNFDPETPSARQSGWHGGAVPRPKNPELLRSIDYVAGRYPVLNDHLNTLRNLGSQIVYAGMCQQRGFRDCAVTHIRFSNAIETGFGFTREVMLFYSPHEDLQSRTFETAVREAQTSSRSVTPDTFFIWSPDQRVGMKLRDWSRPDKLGIPLKLDDENALSLISLLRDHIYSRDLFHITIPVSGASFFGRRTLIQSLRDDVFNQRVTGIFGLRKSGKTSILMKLREELAKDQVTCVYVDLEAFPTPPEDPTDDILAETRNRLIQALKNQNLRTKELSETSKRPSILELKNALQELLVKLSKDGYRVLLMLDEIEYLTPSDKIDVAEGDMPRISQLLAAFRSVVQESTNFSFILSGLTSAIIEEGRLYGRPNPLFSWANPLYVRPLDRSEADDLARTVGGKMGIRILPGALEALHEASGGHAYLYRNLSSAVVKNLPADDVQRTMGKASVLHELEDWKSRVDGNIREIIDHIQRYYPTEGVMLELLRDSPTDFAALAPDEPVALRRLRDLGLIHRTESGYETSVLLELT